MPSHVDSLKLLEAIFEASPDGLMAVDHQNRVIAWNHAFLDILQLPQNYCDFTAEERSRIISEELQAPADLIRFVRQVYEEPAKDHHFESDNTAGRTLLLSTSPLVLGNDPSGVLWVCRDLTQLRTAEHSRDDFLDKYQTLFENVREGLCLYEELPDGRRKLVDCNQRYAELSGRTKEELLACSDTRLLQVNLANDDEVKSNVKSFLQGASWKGLYRWKRPDNKINFISYSATPVKMMSGRFTLGIDWDITDLILARDQAEHSLQSKTMFLARASHEIRTPLTTILGFAELLQEQSLPDTAQSYVKSIAVSGKLLLALINDLLDLSRMESARMEVIPRWVSLKSVIDDIELSFALQFQKKGLTWSLVPPHLLPQIWIDPIRFRQILVNLLGNALKFTERGGVAVRFSLLGSLDHPFGLSFTVQDSGIGIPFEQQAEIFEPFRQAEHDNWPVAEGSGLGLAITKSLVHLMEGRLTMSSTPGEGTSFTVEFPNAEWKKNAKEDSPSSVQEGKEKVLLIADDDLSNRVLVKGFLRESGYKVLEAVNGKEAVELFQQYKPPLILMDLKMPVISGRDAAATLRQDENNKGLTIVAMTAADYQDAFVLNDKDLWDDFLNKPFSRQKLFDLLHKYLP